jgi:hypothetical protein
MRNRLLGPLLLGLIALGAGCDHEKPRPTGAPDATSAPPAASTAASPNASSTASTPQQKGQCPLAVVPGVALGPVRLGATREDLEHLELPTKQVSKYPDTTEFVEVGPIHTKLCAGKVVDAWIDDLRKAPDCVSVAGQKVDRAESRAAFQKRFSSCRDLPPREGGSFVECEGGGVRIGYGMGDFLQVRVAPKGSDIDDTCAIVADDGTPVPLPSDVSAKLLQKTLDLDLLAPFWHSNLPGRDPLRIAKSKAATGTPELSMFGSKVVWADKAELDKKKLPYFVFDKLESSATKVTIEFSFPPEGVHGSVMFKKRFDDWQLEQKQVYER